MHGTADDIVRVAGTEPRLPAWLLQTANPVVFDATGKPVPHLRAAVIRLGHVAMQSVAMVFAIQQMKAEPLLKPVATPLEALWAKSIAVASACQTLARLMRLPTDKVLLVGVVHGIGHFHIIVRAAEAASGIVYADLPAALVAARRPSSGQPVLERWGCYSITCKAVGSQLDHRPSEVQTTCPAAVCHGVRPNPALRKPPAGMPGHAGAVRRGLPPDPRADPPRLGCLPAAPRGQDKVSPGPPPARAADTHWPVSAVH